MSELTVRIVPLFLVIVLKLFSQFFQLFTEP